MTPNDIDILLYSDQHLVQPSVAWILSQVCWPIVKDHLSKGVELAKKTHNTVVGIHVSHGLGLSGP